MLRRLSCATGIVLILASTGMVHGQDKDEDVTLYRVFVADHAEPRITAFDLTEPANRWSFDTAGQSRLYPFSDGAAIAAVQSDADVVHFLRSGVTRSAHGDHSDIEITDPASLPETLSGPRPFYLIDHGGKVAINFDGGDMPAFSTHMPCPKVRWQNVAFRRAAPITAMSRRLAAAGLRASPPMRP